MLVHIDRRRLVRVALNYPALASPQRAGRGDWMSTPAFASDGPLAVTIGEAARRLGVHRETLRAAIERGEVPAARLGRRWLVPIAAIEQLLSHPGNGDASPT
jgi:excisionase family DNA binding protein